MFDIETRRPSSSKGDVWPANYAFDCEELILNEARVIAQRRLERLEDAVSDPDQVKALLQARLGTYGEEHLACMFLDTRHRVIAFEILFRGTIDGCEVHPRVVVRRALHHNAAALILAHNHPGGVPEPSPGDRQITERLRQAFALIDIRVVDHFVVAGDQAVSFAARGLL